MRVQPVLPVLALGLALGCAGLAAPAAAATSRYGKELAGLPPTPLAKLLASPVDGQVVRVEGTVAAVCPKKGCWLVVEDGKERVHVTFEGYSFFVPKDSAGRRVVVEGRVVVKDPDPDDVAHYQGEGAGEAAARKVSIVASGVSLEDPPAAGDEKKR